MIKNPVSTGQVSRISGQYKLFTNLWFVFQTVSRVIILYGACRSPVVVNNLIFFVHISTPWRCTHMLYIFYRRENGQCLVCPPVYWITNASALFSVCIYNNRSQVASVDRISFYVNAGCILITDHYSLSGNLARLQGINIHPNYRGSRVLKNIDYWLPDCMSSHQIRVIFNT